MNNIQDEDVELRKSQLKLVKILFEIDKICKKYQLDYWIDSGTLLGAVRHKGFIPWDDDIDIAMPIESYNRFLEIVKKELPENLYILNYNREKENFCHWIKIKDRTSVCIEHKGQKYDKHLFVDIFPMRRYKEKSKLTYKMYKFFGYVDNLEEYFNAKKVNEYGKKIDFKYVIKKILYILFRKISNNKVNKLNELKIDDQFYRWGYCLKTGYSCFHKNTYIYPLVKIKFEGYEFNAPNDQDGYLQNLYGSKYMDLPPIEKRKAHNIFIKAEVNE